MYKIEKRNIIINSTLLFVVASIIQMSLHETGHFVASLIVRAKEVVLYHNCVNSNTDGLPLFSIILIKAAGPLVSLFIGILFHSICIKMKKRNMLFLFNLYMSIFGYIGVLGYLMIAPFFINSDTDFIFSVLNFPFWLTVSIAMSGVIIAFLLMRNLMKFFIEMGTNEIANDVRIRQSFCIPYFQELLLLLY